MTRITTQHAPGIATLFFSIWTARPISSVLCVVPPDVSEKPATDWRGMLSTPAVVTAGRLAAGLGGANGAAAGHVLPVDTDKVGRSLTNSSAETTRVVRHFVVIAPPLSSRFYFGDCCNSFLKLVIHT